MDAGLIEAACNPCHLLNHKVSLVHAEDSLLSESLQFPFEWSVKFGEFMTCPIKDITFKS